MEEKVVIRDHRRKGWFWASNQVIDAYGPRLGAVGIAVYMCLARHARERSQTAWPSLSRLMKLLATGRHQVLDALAALERERLIQVRRAPGRVNVYTLLDLPVAGAGAAPAAEETGAGAAPDQCCSGTGTGAGAAPEQNDRTKPNNNTGAVVVAGETAVQELQRAGISVAVATDLAACHRPERVREVITASCATPGILDRAAWIVAALRGNWALATATAQAQGGAGRDGARLSCAFRRNPALGRCPTEDAGVSWMPWCGDCERCPW